RSRRSKSPRKRKLSRSTAPPIRARRWATFSAPRSRTAPTSKSRRFGLHHQGLGFDRGLFVLSCRPFAVAANALGHAHISEGPSFDGGVEVFEAVFHGDGTWWFGRWVTVPAAEPADDPGSPCKAVGGMRVSEPFALGFEIAVEGGESNDLFGVEGDPGELAIMAIACLHELEGDDCRP